MLHRGLNPRRLELDPFRKTWRILIYELRSMLVYKASFVLVSHLLQESLHAALLTIFDRRHGLLLRARVSMKQHCILSLVLHPHVSGAEGTREVGGATTRHESVAHGGVRTALQSGVLHSLLSHQIELLLVASALMS